MTVASLVADLARLGYRVRLHASGEAIEVTPTMTSEVRARVVARKPALLAYLRKRRLNVGHAFTALAGADLRSIGKRGVCIACGVPWPMHGKPSLRDWRLVDDPSVVALVDANGAESIPATPLELRLELSP